MLNLICDGAALSDSTTKITSAGEDPEKTAFYLTVLCKLVIVMKMSKSITQAGNHSFCVGGLHISHTTSTQLC